MIKLRIKTATWKIILFKVSPLATSGQNINIIITNHNNIIRIFRSLELEDGGLEVKPSIALKRKLN